MSLAVLGRGLGAATVVAAADHPFVVSVVRVLGGGGDNEGRNIIYGEREVGVAIFNIFLSAYFWGEGGAFLVIDLQRQPGIGYAELSQRENGSPIKNGHVKTQD